MLIERSLELAKESRLIIDRFEGVAPPVGAILKDAMGNIFPGYHGEDLEGEHAEIVALRKAYNFWKTHSGRLILDTAVVTLEPCGVRLRKPGSPSYQIPCARTLVRFGLREVHIGMLDPEIAACGIGASFLQSHGVAIHMFPQRYQREVASLSARYVRRMNEKAMNFRCNDTRRIEHMASLRCFDVDHAPPQSLGFLKSQKFKKFMREELAAYDSLDTSSSFADFLGLRSSLKTILEKATLNPTKDRIEPWENSVFEQLALFFGIPLTEDDHIESFINETVGRWAAGKLLHLSGIFKA